MRPSIWYENTSTVLTFVLNSYSSIVNNTVITGRRKDRLPFLETENILLEGRKVAENINSVKIIFFGEKGSECKLSEFDCITVNFLLETMKNSVLVKLLA